MVSVIIENRQKGLEETYVRFERMKTPPHPLIEIRIVFKNSKTAILKRNSTVRIDGYDCCIDGKYFDLRRDEIREAIYEA